MADYLVPTNVEFVEEIAKSIARSRMVTDAYGDLEQMIGVRVEDNELIEEAFDRIFDSLWDSTGAGAESEKAKYRKDAAAAIRAINLKLITIIE